MVWVVFAQAQPDQGAFSVDLRFGEYHDGKADVFGTPKVVPEPSTAILLGLGLTAIASRRRVHA